MRQHLAGSVTIALVIVSVYSIIQVNSIPDGAVEENNNNGNENQWTSVQLNNYHADEGTDQDYQGTGSGYLTQQTEAAFENNNSNGYESLYESASKPAYTKNDKDNDNYGTYQKNPQTLARVISLSQDPQRLEEIYQAQGISNKASSQLLQNSSSNTNSSGVGGKQKIVLYIKFAGDYPQWSPRNPSSILKWGQATTVASGSAVADNAAFQVVKKNSKNSYGDFDDDDNKHEKKNLASETSYSNDVDKKTCAKNYVKMSSLPFKGVAHTEGWIRTKNNFAVSETERILSRMKMSCKTIGTKENPFNSSDVTDAEGDPRLVNCAFQMCNENASAPLFYFLVDNKGIWAGYSGDTFVSKRKVGIRDRYDGIVDVGLELDRRLGVANYYLNGYKVWTINALGVPPPNDGITKIDYGTIGAQTIVTISKVAFAFGTSKCLDESDPYQPNNSIRLVKVFALDNPFYSNTTQFYDPDELPANTNWGQGAVMDLYKWIVVKTESKTPKRSQALPGVYKRGKN